MWKAIMFVLGLFFLLHAFGTLQIISTDTIGTLFGLQATNPQELATELTPQITFPIFLVFALSAIAIFIKFILPEKAEAINAVLHHSMIKTLRIGARYLTYCFCAVFAIFFVVVIANALKLFTQPITVNAAFLFLAVLCFDSALNIVEKFIAAKRKRYLTKHASQDIH